MPKKACTTSINGTPPAGTTTPSSNVSAAAKPSNQQIQRYYQEIADYRRADGKSRSYRGNCVCDGRWTCCYTKYKHSSCGANNNENKLENIRGL